MNFRKTITYCVKEERIILFLKYEVNLTVIRLVLPSDRQRRRTDNINHNNLK